MQLVLAGLVRRLPLHALLTAAAAAAAAACRGPSYEGRCLAPPPRMRQRDLGVQKRAEMKGYASEAAAVESARDCLL